MIFVEVVLFLILVQTRQTHSSKMYKGFYVFIAFSKRFVLYQMCYLFYFIKLHKYMYLSVFMLHLCDGYKRIYINIYIYIN